MSNIICVYLSCQNTETLSSNRVSTRSTAHPGLPTCGRVASNYNTHGNDENIMQERTASAGRKENGPSWCSFQAPPLIIDRQSPHFPLTVRIRLCQKPLWGKNRSVPKKVRRRDSGRKKRASWHKNKRTNKKWDEDPYKKKTRLFHM